MSTGLKLLIFILNFLMMLLISCQTPKHHQPPSTIAKSHWVGDIHFDTKLDRVDFQLCDSTQINHSRGALRYEGGMDLYKENAQQKLAVLKKHKSYSGFIVVRFLLNCENEMDRFRVAPLAFNFSKQSCPLGLEQQLIVVVQSLTDWEPRVAENTSDCSKYLNFKIIDGEVVDILY